ncbi:MAG: iron-containing alcohol dehydrogenase [Victivallaceae bacterium]|nr:iron-containing alcohol dehydrogenase [Victivallaceae bacterium]
MWKFKLPTEVIFGSGSTNRLNGIADTLGKRKIIVTDNVLAELPLTGGIIANLNNALLFAEVQPNPTVANVDALTAVIRAEKIEVIIALGGGSSIDCAKAASCLAKTTEQSIRKFHSGGAKLGNEHLPVIAVPTTAGTGSEVTPFAVLDDVEKNFKGPIAAEALYPVIAVVDSALSCSVPLKVTAATALDALSHAIEGYWSKNHQPICDTLALEAGKMIFANLANVLNNPDDKTGRDALAYAALLAGMAFQLPKNAIIHACSFPLSNRFHLPHGVACALTMEGAIRLNTPYMNGRMEQFAVYCDFNDIATMTAAITDLKQLGGLPLTLKEAGIENSDIKQLIEESFHPLMNNNPKEVTKEDLAKIYAELA